MCASPLLTRTPSFGHDEAATSVSSAYWPSPAASAVAPTLHIIAQHLPIKFLCRRLEVLTPWRHESMFRPCRAGGHREAGHVGLWTTDLLTFQTPQNHRPPQHTPTTNGSAVAGRESTSQHPLWRTDLQFTPDQPCRQPNQLQNGHNTHNFGPPNPQQQFMGSCKQKQCTNVSVSCNNMARSVHIKSTLSYFLSTWPAAGSMLQIDHHIGNQLTEGRNRAVYTYRCFGSMAVNASELFWFCCSPMTNYDNYAILRRF